MAFRDGSVAAERRYARRHALGTTCYEADSGRVMECGVLSGALAAARHELSVSDHVLFGNLVPTLLSLLNGNPLAATRGDDPRR